VSLNAGSTMLENDGLCNECWFNWWEIGGFTGKCNVCDGCDVMLVFALMKFNDINFINVFLICCVTHI